MTVTDSMSRRVAYLGPEFSHSHQQAQETWPDAEHIPCKAFPDIINGIAGGRFGRGVIPFHNTSGQSVKDAQHALHAAGAVVSVTAVKFRKIIHSIGGFGAISDARVVASKDIVFEQCKQRPAPKSCAATGTVSARWRTFRP